MKMRAIVMLGVALLLAGASVFLARNWVQNQVQPVAGVEDKQKVETTTVVVASTQLHYGNKLRREHLRVVDWPITAVPEGSFKTVEDIIGKQAAPKKKGDKDQAVTASRAKAAGKPKDRVVLRTIEINEPILKGKITGFGGRASLSTLISPGMRATTIRVNDISGVAGFVLPGDRVDILLTRNPGTGGTTGRSGLQVSVFLQNMKVLAIAQDANEDRNKPGVVKAVTLEVTTIQAQKLTLARKLGSLSLALRHVNTVDAFKPVSISARDLRYGEANLAPKPKGDGETATAATTIAVEPAAPAAAPAPVVATTTSESPNVVTKAVTKDTKKNMSTIKIVRGLKAKEYEVTPEKPTFSAPAYSKPLNLLPSGLAPAGGVVAPAAAPAPYMISPLAPAAPTMLAPTMVAPGMTAPGAPTPAPAGETALDSESGVLSTTEPISLLKNSGGQTGDDG